MDNDDISIHPNKCDFDPCSDDLVLRLDMPFAEIIQMHINEQQMVDFRTTIKGRKTSNIWDTGVFKSVIS